MKIMLLRTMTSNMDNIWTLALQKFTNDWINQLSHLQILTQKWSYRILPAEDSYLLNGQRCGESHSDWSCPKYSGVMGYHWRSDCEAQTDRVKLKPISAPILCSN
jgi:hypothetical protein